MPPPAVRYRSADETGVEAADASRSGAGSEATVAAAPLGSASKGSVETGRRRNASMSIPSFVIGIAGGTGAGKTTVSRLVTRNLGDDVTRIPLDNYYRERSDLSVEERSEINYDHPSAFEWDLLRDHLEALLEGRSVEMPRYDFEVHNRTDERTTVEPTDVVVLEGILALHDEAINAMLDLRLYVETDADVRILRRIRRDVLDRGRDLEGVIDQYLSTVKPMHERFVEPTRAHADLIIPEGANSVAVTLIEETLRAEIEGNTARSWERGSLERELAAERSSDLAPEE